MATANDVKYFRCKSNYCGGLSHIIVIALTLFAMLTANAYDTFADSSISTISLNSGSPGSTGLSVTVTGNFTNWVNQVTMASFGPGISVGGAAVGQSGPVAVTNANTLIATITIDPQAAVGTRNVVIQTGTEQEIVQNGFTVLSCSAIPPSWIMNNPQQNASNVPLNPFIQIKFDAPLDRTTLNTTDFIIRDSVTGLNIPATVSVDASGRIISLTPSQSLAVNRQHLVAWGNFGGNAQIKDTCGTVLPNQSYNFTTALTEGRTGPSLVVNNPINGATNIPENVSVGLQFSEPVNPISLSTGLVVTTGNNTVPGSLNFSTDYSQVIFVPSSTLLPNTVYVITCTSKLQDLAGNFLVNPGSFSFTTGSSTDVAQGSITGVNPASGLSGVGTNVTPTVYFSERVNPLTLTASNFYLYDYNTRKTIPTTISVAADQMSATLIPAQPLQPYTTYSFANSNYYHQSYYDIAGNVFGYGGPWSFTTGSGTITTAPAVSVISPPNGANGTPVNGQVVAVMSAQLNTNTVGQSAITVTPQGSSTPVAGTVSLASDQVTLTWAPAALLATSTTYNVTVGGFQDPQGNAVAPYTGSFTTGTSS
ncbi:Ig-like domain-containing protein, partial [Oryzomonas rubra]